MVTVLPFFLDRLRGTPFHDSFASWLSFLFNGVGLVAMGLATWAGSRFTNSSSFFVLLTTLICLFGFLAILPFLSLSASAFFGVTLLTSGLLASAGGFLQTSTIALAPKYGPTAITAYMAGSALSAVGVSALQVVTAYTSSSIELPDLDSASWSATICFIISAMILVLTLVSYRALKPKEGLARFKSPQDLCIEIPPSERTRLLPPCSQPSPPQMPQNVQIESPDTHYSRDFAIFYAGIITLCLFPAITAIIEPNNTNIDPLVFNALHFLVFNVADLSGRGLASIQIFSPTNDTFLIAYSLARTIFIPVFLMCNIMGLSAPVIVTSDAGYMLVLFLFSLTHGHCSTLSLLAASEDGDEGEGGRAASLTQFWMMAGIVIGGGASFGVRAII